jgi:hypothetical protein
MICYENEYIFKLIFNSISPPSPKDLSNQINKRLYKVMLYMRNSFFHSLGNKTVTLFKAEQNKSSYLFQDFCIIKKWQDNATSLELWDINKNHCLKTFKTNSLMLSVILLPNNNIALINDSIDIYNIQENFKHMKTIQTNEDYSLTLQVEPISLANGDIVCNAWYDPYPEHIGEERYFLIYDTNSSSLVNTISTKSEASHSLISLSDNSFAFSYFNKIEIWGASNSIFPWSKKYGKIKELHVSASGTAKSNLSFSRVNNILTSVNGAYASLISTAEYQCIKTIKLSGDYLLTCTLMLPCSYLAIGAAYGNIFIFDLLNNKCVKSLRCGNVVDSLQLSGNYRVIISSRQDNIILLNY